VQVRIAEVKFKGLEYVNPEYLLTRTTVRAGDSVDVSRISEDALRLSALQDFDSVGYTLIGDAQNATLEWEPHEKSWGPDYMKFDLGVYASAGGDLAFAIDAQHTRNWVNSLGGQWRNELQFGYENRLETHFYQPLVASQRWFVEPRAGAQQSIEDLYLGGDRVAKYVYKDLGASLDFGGNFGRYTQARLGYGYLDRNFHLDTGSLILPEGSRNDGGFTAGITHDSRDKRFSATRGWAGVVEYTIADDSLGGDRNWQRGEVAVSTTIPLGRNLIFTTLAGGTDFNSDLPFDRVFSLGGPGSFPGFELGELRARDYASISGSYLHKLADIISLRGQAIYMGLRLQAADVNRLDLLGTQSDSSIYGGSLYLTGSTPVGPLTLGYGKTSTDAWSLWLAIGRPIGHGTAMERGIFR
jgi:NTE family protein